ncbi:MAG TPA: helix-turn-helix transcriptional regulator [Desulfomonilia bacterium]|nr:helix-turn-helix transcriptional regulator [Desulfomonilia bacterium]
MKDDYKELLTVREASKLLKINEKKLYALVKEGRLPGTKVTGKWLFPKAELEQFVKGKARDAVRKSFWESLIEKKVLLVCGSDDSLIQAAQGHFHKMFPEYLLFSSIVGSREGIRLLSEGFCTIAVSHLYDHASGDFNFPCMREFFPDPDDLVVINLFYRTLGFVSRDVAVQSMKECVDNALRFINRQEGSGVRALVDHLLIEEGVEPSQVMGFETKVFTHFDVVRSVATGSSDMGIATEAVSLSPRLVFFPIFEERFDMIVKKSVFFDRHVQAFVEFIRSDTFRELLKTMKGYSDRDTGKVVYPK